MPVSHDIVESKCSSLTLYLLLDMEMDFFKKRCLYFFSRMKVVFSPCPWFLLFISSCGDTV